MLHLAIVISSPFWNPVLSFFAWQLDILIGVTIMSWCVSPFKPSTAGRRYSDLFHLAAWRLLDWHMQTVAVHHGAGEFLFVPGIKKRAMLCWRKIYLVHLTGTCRRCHASETGWPVGDRERKEEVLYEKGYIRFVIWICFESRALCV